MVAASQHDPHIAGCLGPTRMPGMVSRQLLPHGLDGHPSGHDLWSQAGGSVDDWVKKWRRAERKSNKEWENMTMYNVVQYRRVYIFSPLA
jgi:hypothetical protein